jgi:hypothetical protein
LPFFRAAWLILPISHAAALRLKLKDKVYRFREKADFV